MKVYRYKIASGNVFACWYVVAASVSEALGWLADHGMKDVTSIEELGPVEIVPARETP